MDARALRCAALAAHAAWLRRTTHAGCCWCSAAWRFKRPPLAAPSVLVAPPLWGVSRCARPLTRAHTASPPAPQPGAAAAGCGAQPHLQVSAARVAGSAARMLCPCRMRGLLRPMMACWCMHSCTMHPGCVRVGWWRGARGMMARAGWWLHASWPPQQARTHQRRTRGCAPSRWARVEGANRSVIRVGGPPVRDIPLANQAARHTPRTQTKLCGQYYARVRAPRAPPCCPAKVGTYIA